MTRQLAEPSAPVQEFAGPARRVVLLGASNLTRGLGTVLATARRIWGQPLEVLAAGGHGRSFGQSSRALGRELPGIVECGLWAHLAGLPQAPTAALVTDIGNDLLYEQPVEQIVDWVAGCLQRLSSAESRVIVTLLPVANLDSISRARFHLLRRLFFPRSRLAFEEVRRRALELNDRVRGLATDHGAQSVAPRGEWYGIDPIHIRLRWRSAAWSEILAGWSHPRQVPVASRTTLKEAWYLHSRTPQRRRVFGIEQQAAQPSARLADGTTVAIF